MTLMIRFRILLMVFIGSIALVTTLAQYTTAYTFHALTTKEGLSQSTNAFVYHDSYGFVWISSLDGLNRYDGRRVKVYKSDENSLNSLYGANIQSSFFEDQQGDLWFSTDKAINCYRRKSGKLEHYFVQKDGIQYKDSLRFYHAFFLDTLSHQLWVTAANGLFKFNIKTHESNFLHTTKAVRFGVQQNKKQNNSRLFSCFWLVQKGLEIVEYDIRGTEINRIKQFHEIGKPAPYTLDRKSVV